MTTFKLLSKAFLGQLTCKDIIELDMTQIIHDIRNYDGITSIKEAIIIVVGFTSIVKKAYKQLKNDIISLNTQNIDGQLKQTEFVKRTKVKQKPNRVYPHIIHIEQIYESQSQSEGTSNLAQRDSISIPEEKIRLEQYQKSYQLDVHQYDQFETPMKHNYEQEAVKLNYREIEERMRLRPLKHVEPLLNFTELMKIDIDTNQDLTPTPKTKKKLARKRLTINNPTMDKSISLLKKNYMDDQKNNNNPIRKSYSDAVDLRDLLTLKSKNLRYIDSVDEQLFSLLTFSDLNIEKSSMECESYHQYNQILNDHQQIRDEDSNSVQSDHLQSRGDTSSQYKKSNWQDEIPPHNLLQTIKETTSFTESRSKMNISLMFQNKQSVQKAQAFYEILISVKKDRRFVLMQDEPESFGDIVCIIQD